MSDEVLEASIEMANGETKTMSIKKVDDLDWSEIKEGTNGLLMLISGQQFLVVIMSADYEGVSFKTDKSDKRALYYDSDVIHALFVEV